MCALCVQFKRIISTFTSTNEKILGINSTIGERIAQLRKEQGYSQLSLSEQLEGFNRDHIVKLENNKVQNPKRELLAQIVRILHTSYEYLETGNGIKDTRNQVNGHQPVYQKKKDDYIFKMLELYLEKPTPTTKELLAAEIVRIMDELDKANSDVKRYRDQIVAVLDRLK